MLTLFVTAAGGMSHRSLAQLLFGWERRPRSMHHTAGVYMFEARMMRTCLASSPRSSSVCIHHLPLHSEVAVVISFINWDIIKVRYIALL